MNNPLDWLPAPQYCRLTGETQDTIDNRLRAGHWLRDIHTRVPPGSKVMWVNMVAVNDWCYGEKPAHLHGKKR
jgi:hypothetical protein